MANYRLTAKPFTRNDVATLAQLFDCVFTHYLNPDVLFYRDYLGSLRTVIGLGYTAALAHGAFSNDYQVIMHSFLTESAGDFRDPTTAKTVIAQATAQMVQLATQCFYYLHYPTYYESFFAALQATWQRIHLIDSERAKQVERLLLKLG